MEIKNENKILFDHQDIILTLAYKVLSRVINFFFNTSLLVYYGSVINKFYVVNK